MRLPTSYLSAIFLTHFHSDHIGDLGEANVLSCANGRTKPLDIYGPEGVEKVVNGFIMAYEQDTKYRHDHHGDEVFNLKAAIPISKTIKLQDPNERELIFDYTSYGYSDIFVQEYNNDGILESLIILCDEKEAFKREFKTDLVYLLEPLYDVTISEVNFPAYLEALTHLVIKHGLKVPSDLLLMNKTILILDNIGRQLDPGFNAVTAVEPYAAKLVKKRLSPQRVFDKTKDNISEISDILLDTPKQINRLLRKTLRDDLSFKIDPMGMEKLILDIDRSSNRLAFSIIVAAIIIGSSMLIQSNIGGQIFGFPTIGAIGFLVAILLGVRLLISILRSGRL